jgi:hypothetical protein
MTAEQRAVRREIANAIFWLPQDVPLAFRHGDGSFSWAFARGSMSPAQCAEPKIAFSAGLIAHSMIPAPETWGSISERLLACATQL